MPERLYILEEVIQNTMVKMTLDTNRHLEENDIERYSMGRIPESELAPVEEHLLICEPCRDRLTESDSYIASMRRAAEQSLVAEPLRKRRSAWFSFLLPAFATALLLAVVTVTGLPSNHPAAPVAMTTINLEATRGAGIQARVPAATPMDLQFELATLTPAPYYRLEIVNNTGERRWSGRAIPGPFRALAAAPPMRAGIYFVRLYLPSGEQLREYGLEVYPR